VTRPAGYASKKGERRGVVFIERLSGRYLGSRGLTLFEKAELLRARGQCRTGGTERAAGRGE